MDFLAGLTILKFSADHSSTYSLHLGWLLPAAPALPLPHCGELPGDQVCSSSSSMLMPPPLHGQGGCTLKGHTRLLPIVPQHEGPGAAAHLVKSTSASYLRCKRRRAVLSSLVLSSSSLSLQGEPAAPVVRKGQPSLHPAQGSRGVPSRAEKQHPRASRSAAPEQPASRVIRGVSREGKGRGGRGPGDLSFPCPLSGCSTSGLEAGRTAPAWSQRPVCPPHLSDGQILCYLPPAPRPGR